MLVKSTVALTPISIAEAGSKGGHDLTIPFRTMSDDGDSAATFDERLVNESASGPPQRRQSACRNDATAGGGEIVGQLRFHWPIPVPRPLGALLRCDAPP